MKKYFILKLNCWISQFQCTRPQLKGKWHYPKDSELSNWECVESIIVSLTDRRRQRSLLGSVKPTWCCHGMKGTSDTWTKPAPLLLCLSHLSPIISPPAHLLWQHSPQLTATYITLTNQRLQGFFPLPRIYQWHLLLPFRCPLQRGDLLSWKNDSSLTLRPLHISV